MSRDYDSSRRRARAEATRCQILDAAVQLHGRGEMGYAPLAETSGVPLPTVRHHFPTRERLYEGCTAHFLDDFEAPDLEKLATIRDGRARVRALVAAVCDALEESHDLLWHSAPLIDESPAMAAAAGGFAALLDEAAAVACGPRRRSRARIRVRGLLDPLTYRAFRVQAGLEAGATRRELTALVGCALGLAPASNTSRRRTR